MAVCVCVFCVGIFISVSLCLLEWSRLFGSPLAASEVGQQKIQDINTHHTETIRTNSHILLTERQVLLTPTNNLAFD